MSEWKEYKLGEISEDVSYGYTESANENPVGPKFLRITDIREGSINWEKVPYCTIKEKDFVKCKIEIGDIVIARTGATTGITETIKHNVNAVFASYLIRFRINKSIANPFFVGYVLKSNFWKDYVSSIVGGSAQPGANAKQFSDFSLRLPSLQTQTAIAEILSSLDDKIELNNKINQELEALAQTLFKQWFVDFDFPNENGEPYKSSGGEMVESELGEIPKGWEVVELSNLLTVKYGKDHKHLSDGIYPLYGSGGIMRYVEKPLYQHNSILIPRKGTLSNLFYLEEPFWSVDTMFYTEIHNPIFGKYLFHCIKALDIASMNVGSAVPSMTTKVLNELKILNPSDLVIQEFDTALSAFHNSINQNKKETEDLTNLRDTLLPKLISGELEINEISH